MGARAIFHHVPVWLGLCLVSAVGTADEGASILSANAALPSNLKLLQSELVQPEELPTDWNKHPLAPALVFALRRYEHIHQEVKDFTCVLAKRERIDGRLRDYQYLSTKVRREQRNGEEVIVPFSVYAEFLAPASLRGRRVLFVDGRNDNKMMVRNGGRRFNYITVNISPDSEAARRESHYPITELGLDHVVRRLIERAQDDMQADPSGANTKVEFFRQAKVDKRPCTHIRVTHAARADGLGYHLANIYVDEELKVPVRVEAFDWPKAEGEPPPLLEEYTYMRLKLNVGLTESDFSEELLKQ